MFKKIDAEKIEKEWKYNLGINQYEDFEQPRVIQSTVTSCFDYVYGEINLEQPDNCFDEAEFTKEHRFMRRVSFLNTFLNNLVAIPRNQTYHALKQIEEEEKKAPIDDES